MRRITRRRFLRGTVAGAAVGLALPAFETFRPARAQAPDDGFFGLFFWANGTPWHAAHGREQGAAGHPDLWTPAAVGADYAPSPLLEPLARHRVTVLTGLEPHTDVPPDPPGQSDGHMRGFMVGMTGDRIRPDGFDHGSHSLTALRPTLDQFVARHPGFYANQPLYRSLEVGVSRARFHGYGHWNAISYNGSYSTNLPILQPSALYDRLFVAPPDRRDVDRRLLVLDAVLDDARSLRGHLGGRDRLRLERHLDHVRDLQIRVAADAPICAVPDRPSDVGSLLDKTRLMGELLALAIECRLTRVFSMMLTSPASTHVFSHLGVPDGNHKTCHDGHWERVRIITQHHMECFGAFLDAFAVPGADGSTLLDRGLIYGTSEYGEGWHHSVHELPVVLAGRAGGALADATHVRQARGNVSRAQLTALRALGLDVPGFGWNGGQTDQPFDELLR